MTWAFLLSNKWARRAVLGAGIAAVLLTAFFLMRSHYINQGKDQGKQESGQTVKQESRKAVTAAREDLTVQQEGHEDRIAALQQDLTAARTRANQAASDAAAARQERDAAQHRLASIQDADLHPFIINNLNKRQPGDQTPGFLPAEEREIAQCLVERVGCTKENAGLVAQVQELQRQVEKLEGQQAEQKGELADLAGYTQTVEHAYVEIYNAFPRKTNRLIWLFTAGRKGKEKQMPFQDPKVLLGRPRSLRRL